MKAIKTQPRVKCDLPIVEQVRKSMHKQNRLAMICGFILGSFVPVASFTLGHYEAPENGMMWLLVGGGLAYSAMTVFQWATVAFKHPAKALGFCVLIEGVMTFSHTVWLSLAGLALLVMINGLATGSTLALDQRQTRGFK